MSVSNSASTAISRLFGTVAVTAGTVSSVVETAGTSVEALNVKANAWLRDVRIDAVTTARVRMNEIRAAAAMRSAELLAETKQFTDKSQFHQDSYLASLAEIDADLKAAGLIA